MIARQFPGLIAFIVLCISCVSNAEDKDLSCAERQVVVNSMESGLNLDSEFDTLKVTNLIRTYAEFSNACPNNRRMLVSSASKKSSGTLCSG